MALLLGAKDLGLIVQWRFGFVEQGTPVETTPGVLYLDVGGTLKTGVVDHHSGSAGATSTSELIVRYPEHVYNHLLSPWLDRAERGIVAAGTSWTPTIVTHADPDFDGVVAAFLAMHLVETGGLPDYAAALAAYGRDVDQGRCDFAPERGSDRLYALHHAYLVIQVIPRLRHEERLLRGLALLRTTIERITAAKQEGLFAHRWNKSHFLPPTAGVTEWTKQAEFADLKSELDAEPDRFARDRAKATILPSVELPCADDARLVGVPTFISPEPMESRLNKYWVRAAGYPFFICPYGATSSVSSSDSATVFPTVFLSLDPNTLVQGKRPTLQGLGFALEQMESSHRRRLNAGLDDRTGEPRFPNGYCENGDPWYDGRAFNYSIVVSPIGGTRLPYQTIVAQATQTKFWEIPLLESSLTLVWLDPTADTQGEEWQSLPSFAGMAATLRALYGSSQQRRVAMSLDVTVPEWCHVEIVDRRYPAGTSPSMRLLKMHSSGHATVESLVAVRQKFIAAYGDTPAYVLGRIAPGRHFGSADRLRSLMLQLGDSDLRPLSDVAVGDQVALFNGRMLLFHGELPAGTLAAADPDLEVLLYVAFLSETITEFSRTISKFIPEDGTSVVHLDTKQVREDFLRFQAAYFQMEVSRTPRDQSLFKHLVQALDIFGHYKEVQDELDRLNQLEEQLERRRQEKVEGVLGFVLYLVAIAGVLQTVAAFWGLDSATLHSTAFLSQVAVLIAVALTLYVALNLARKRR